MGTYATSVFGPVAVLAKYLESILGEAISTQPPIDIRANLTPMFFAIIVYVIYCKELLLGFSAAGAFVSVSLKNLFAQFVSIGFAIFRPLMSVVFLFNIHILFALIAIMPRLGWVDTALGTYSHRPLLLAVVVHIRRFSGALSLNAFKALSGFLVLDLVHVRIAFKRFLIFDVATNLANGSKSIGGPFIGAKVLKRTGLDFVAFVATLLWCIVLGYNVAHGTSPFSGVSSRLRLFAATRGQKTYSITPLFYHKIAFQAILREFTPNQWEVIHANWS